MRQCAIDIEKEAAVEKMPMGVGLHPGQASHINLSGGWEKYGDKILGPHDILGAVHVGLQRDGKVVIAIEASLELSVEVRPVVRRHRWVWKEHWAWDEKKHDNVRLPALEDDSSPALRAA